MALNQGCSGKKVSCVLTQKHLVGFCKVGVVSRERRMGSSLKSKSAGNPGVKLNMAISPPSVVECWETLENAEKCVLCIFLMQKDCGSLVEGKRQKRKKNAHLFS